MSQEKFWVLFSKKVAAEASNDEIVELEKLIQQHPEWQLAVQNIEDLWRHQPKLDDSLEAEDAYILHLNRINEQHISFGDYTNGPPVYSLQRNKKWYWAVAILLSCAGLFSLFNSIYKNKLSTEINPRQVNEVSTRPGSKTKIQLPDGSIVWLNADSKLEYNKNFDGELREVQLTGEAFFDVVKNPQRPFIVHTSSADIKVLGTSFNVKSYPDDKITETSLIKGSVEVTIKKRPGEKWMLKPNEKLVVLNEYIQPQPEVKLKNKIDPRPYLAIKQLTYQPGDTVAVEAAWIQNKLSFEDETFEEVARKMERWYDVQFEFRKESLKELMLHAAFTNETLEQVMEGLEFSFRFKYKIENKSVIIYN